MSWGAVAATTSAVVGAGAAKSDRDNASKQAKRDREAIKQGYEESKQYINTAYPRMEEFRLGGYQGAQDIFKSVVPQQMQAFQQGNMQAQQTQSALPQQAYNALMGLPVDTGFLQPKAQFEPNFEFLNQEFVTPEMVQTPQDATNEAINTQVEDEVINAYKMYLGREPDPSGMEIYKRVVMDDGEGVSGRGVKRMIEAMKKSEEGRAYAASQAAQQPQEGFGNLVNRGTL